VILGDDQSVGGRALAGDVKVDNLSLNLTERLACESERREESSGLNEGKGDSGREGRLA